MQPSLHHDVEAFLEAFPQVRPSQIGKLALRDSQFVADLRIGRKVRPGTAKKVRDWMANFARAEEQRAAERREALNRIKELAAGGTDPQ